MELGSYAVALVALAVLGWLAFLIATSLRGRGRLEVPPNLAPFQTNEELESKRLERWQASAVVLSGILALSLPIYFLSEQNRQEGFAEEFSVAALERGAHWIEEFQCTDCHGPELGGGASSFLESRSGVRVSWAAPALDDLFFEFNDEDIRFWVVYGRANTPMPPWGVAGGGPLSDQQIDEIMAFIKSIQVRQDERLARVDPAVISALSRLETADRVVAEQIAAQQAIIDDIRTAPSKVATAEALAEEAATVLRGAGEGIDSDGDGVSDRAEVELTRISQEAHEALQRSAGSPVALAVTLDPQNSSSVINASDADSARRTVAAIEAEAVNLRVTTDNQEKLLAPAEDGLAWLRDAAAAKSWEIDIGAIAEATFDGNLEDAERAVGLYQSNCARCHTAGYNAGVPFTLEVGAGGLGPALWKGRSQVQFRTLDDTVGFVIEGSDAGQPYGVDGVGTGRMPGFGAVLSLDDIRLVVRYLRGDTLTGK